MKAKPFTMHNQTQNAVILDTGAEESPAVTGARSQTERVYRGVSEVYRVRTAHKTHRCSHRRWDTVCVGIEAGDPYVQVTVYPGHDFVETTVPVTSSCCVSCATGWIHMDSLVAGLIEDGLVEVQTIPSAPIYDGPIDGSVHNSNRDDIHAVC